MKLGYKMTDKERSEFVSIRKEAGQQINPDTAEVFSCFVQSMDPYGIDADLPEVLQQITPECFARAPGSEVWVWFGDLPEPTRDSLERRKDKLNLEVARAPAAAEPKKHKFEVTKTYWIEADDYRDACSLARDDSARVTVRPIVFVAGQHVRAETFPAASEVVVMVEPTSPYVCDDDGLTSWDDRYLVPVCPR